MVKKDWWSQEFRKLVTLGESTTAGGWSTTPERCWASLLAELINDFQSRPVKLFNGGIGANVISTRSPGYPYSGKPAATERLGKHVIEQHPDLVVISYGLNDARSGTPLELFREELVTIVRRVRQELQPLITLMGPYYMTDFTLGGEHWSHADLPLFYRFNEVVSQVAREQQCLFANILAANGGTDWMVHYDGCHANDLGHRIIANRIFEVLAQNCSCLAKRTKDMERTSPRWRDESTLTAHPVCAAPGDHLQCASHVPGKECGQSGLTQEGMAQRLSMSRAHAPVPPATRPPIVKRAAYCCRQRSLLKPL